MKIMILRKTFFCKQKANSGCYKLIYISYPAIVDSSFVEGGAYPKVLKVRVNGVYVDDKGIDLLEMPFGDMASAEGSGKGFIITRLINKDGKNVYVVINQDYIESQEATIVFNKFMKCSQLPMTTLDRITMILRPGEWLVFTEV